LGVLRYADFRLLWVAGLISLLGDAMHNVAEGWLVLDLTGSPSALSTTFALATVPVALVTLVGGVYADRWDRRTTLIVVNSTRLLLVASLALLVVTGSVRVWHVWAMAVGMGLLTAFGAPAIQSLIPSLVPAGAVSGAIGFNLASNSLAGILGRSLGGWLVGAAGVWPVLFLNALSFLAPVLVLEHLRRTSPAPAPAGRRDRRALWRDLVEGVGFLKGRPRLATVLLVWSCFSLLEVPCVLLAPAFARDVLRVGPEGLGLLMGGFSGGFFVGSLAAARWANRAARPLPFAIPGSGATLFILLYGQSTLFPLTLLALGGIGWFIGFMGVTEQTIVTTGSPDAMRGRVLSLNIIGLSAPLPIGNLLLGAVAERLGPPAAVTLAGAALLTLLLTAAGALAWTGRTGRPRRRFAAQVTT
jgi:predicted MFS family arabinose efflux permease